MIKNIVPKENIDIYYKLYLIENALRELIIDSLNEVDGPLWYKRRLPPDILDKYVKAKEYEKSVKYFDLIPHHPIYYTDFPDLKKIIEKKDNWKDAFEAIFSRSDIFGSTISELEFIRNKIAHNRKATNNDIIIIKGAYVKLMTAIGETRFNELSKRCTYAADIIERLKLLKDEAQRAFEKCKDFCRCESLDCWLSIQTEWWFDELYLGNKIDGIIDFFRDLEEYNKLPRKIGTGHKIEEWVKAKNMREKHEKVQVEFSDILCVGR